MDPTTKLIILGKLDGYITSMSRKTYVANLGMESEDLIQEGRLKVLLLIERYKHLPVQELIALCIGSLSNFYRCFIRKSHLGRNSGILIDLDEAFYLADKDRLKEIFIDLQIRQLYEIFEGDERRVFDCLLQPPVELVNLAQRRYTVGYTSEVKFTRGLLAGFLGMSKCHLRATLESMRLKAIPILGI